MRRESAKTAKQRQETNPRRKAFVASFWLCHCCCKRPSTDCHEIAAGGSRAKATLYRECWLALCRKCHEEIQGWPRVNSLARQLAIKKDQDPKHYDRELVLKVKHLAATAITEEEVESWTH